MSLVDDLIERNRAYNGISNRIITKYAVIFDELFRYFIPNNRKTSWKMLDFHPSNSLLLWVLGICEYEIGDLIQTNDGEIIEITEANSNITTPVKLVVPTKSIDTGNVAEALTFIGEYNELLRETPSEIIDQMVGNHEFLAANFTVFNGAPNPEQKKNPNIFAEFVKSDKSTRQQAKQVELYDGFDVSGLDDTQIKQLKLLNLKGTS